MPEQPNILFVFSDQHRWCDLGCYGNAHVHSPNFDRFASEGLCCDNAISNTPVCVPARGGLLTGRYPLRHGAITNDLAINPKCPSVATALKAGGYHTGYFGKWHLNGTPRDEPVAPDRRLGFQEWNVHNCSHDYQNSFYYDTANQVHEINGYDATTYTSLAVDFIQRQANNESPWALWLSWGPPHDPYFAVPQKYLDQYAGQRIPLRPNVPEHIVDRIDLDRYWDRETVEQNLHGYYAHITALDCEFGRLLAALKASGQLDNTIIVYTSDHGDQLGSQGWTNKQLPYEESIHVPLLVKGPGVGSGHSDALIGLNDLPVSILALAGIEMPDADGKDLSQIFKDPAAPGLDACYLSDLVPCHQSTWRGTNAWRGVRTQQYTYACHDDGRPWLLFDNEVDPRQQNNLVNAPELAEVRDELHTQTTQFAANYDALKPWPQLLEQYGQVDAWNHSQKHFGLPELGTESP
ncbi:sulfatase family protein [Coraliomargarita sp. W4R72]